MSLYRPSRCPLTKTPTTQATNELSTIYGPQLIYEAIFTISFVEEDGKLKLSRCEEFIDSQEYNKFVAKIASVAAEGVPQAAA